MLTECDVEKSCEVWNLLWMTFRAGCTTEVKPVSRWPQQPLSWLSSKQLSIHPPWLASSHFGWYRMHRLTYASLHLLFLKQSIECFSISQMWVFAIPAVTFNASVLLPPPVPLSYYFPTAPLSKTDSQFYQGLPRMCCPDDQQERNYWFSREYLHTGAC